MNLSSNKSVISLKASDQTLSCSVCILGMGYVGLTLSSVLASIGFNVTCIDRDINLIESLKAGKPHFYEKGLDQLLLDISNSTTPLSFHVGLTEACADIYVVTVGTPIKRPSLEPDLNHVRNAVTEVAKVLRPGNLVILRSTVPVGVTRGLVLPLLEEISGLKAGTHFSLAFCPERTVEGKALRELRELPQIIGGLDETSSKIAHDLFKHVTATIINVGSIEAAEMLKILDNTYRDVMFAYANQLALVCEAVDLDMKSIVQAANQGYNRNNIPVPSPGVGGACLSKDPYILASLCRKVGIDPMMFIKARAVNESMPVHVVNRVYDAIKKMGGGLSGGTIFVMGFAFKGKPETSDMRDSPTLDLIRELKQRGTRILGHDPLVSKSEIEALGVEFTDLEKGFEKSQAVIIMIDHPYYADLNIVQLANRARHPLVLMDGWRLFDASSLKMNSNIIYLSV